MEEFWSLVVALDARLAVPGGRRVRVDFDGPPAPGDTVLVYDGDRVRALVFDEVLGRPLDRVWIVGVVRGALAPVSCR